MKVKILQIRLLNEFLRGDEDEINNFMKLVEVKKTSTQLVVGQPDYWSVLIFYNYKNVSVKIKSGTKISFSADIDLSEEEKKIYETLKQWRFDKAVELKLPSYMITSNAELISVTKVKPQTFDELIKIKGFGGQKVAKYGSDIIAALNSVN